VEGLDVTQERAEACLLGALMIDSARFPDVAAMITPEDFGAPGNRIIFDTFAALHGRKTAIDLVTVTAELTATKQMEKAGGWAYVAGLVDEIPSVENVMSYAAIVRDAAVKRRLVDFAYGVASSATSGDATAALEEASRGLARIAHNATTGQLVSGGAVARLGSDYMQRTIDAKGEMLGLATGLERLDDLLQGLHPANLIVLAARPGMGKTALAVNLAADMALWRRKKVAFFSLEMSAEELALRVLCGEAHVNLKSIRSNTLRRSERRALFLANRALANSDLFIDDSARATVEQIRARALRLQATVGLDCVFVDYLQIMGYKGRSENRVQIVAEFSAGLKTLAKELGVPVIALSQLSRRVEQRGGEESREPQLSDLRESGAIEQDADVVIFINRESYHDKDAPKNVADIIVAKHRNGANGKFRASWLGQFMRFSNLRRYA
jgi:replicative DNA helicase